MKSKLDNFDKQYTLKVLPTLGIVLRLCGFILIGSFLSGLLFSLITGITITDFNRMIFKMEEETKARFFLLSRQALNALFIYFILPILYIYVFQKDLKQIFLVRTERLGSFILLSLLIFITALPFLSQLIEFNQQIQLPESLSNLQAVLLRLEQEAQQITNLIVLYDNWYEIIPILFVVAVLAGFGEELLFRGIIQNEIHRIYKNPHIAIWLSAALFSFIHFQFQGFLPRMVLGGLLGYLYYWSGSLLIPIVIHFVNNALTFTLINYARYKGEAFTNTNTSLGFTIISTIVCMILLIACYRLFSKVKAMSFH
ncbi:CPBP family intramembrane glutamic endopeptidase [Xanthocytophaga flava]|uniref:CPBP family intramembrane glutamic endopeptidase n=1 Tax=Xanthocytophaga flava TaxID=3048013 RepID=UPI0028D65DE1|nr:CPBP family intramembrane glutamic endopeptidase [Xanthocytophaga flavus]MDJ1473695.1 CPBP family intramembrane metalloprotease [Xanthocytophaga flavus]